MRNSLFDKNFREALNRAEATPPPLLWATIADRMEQQSRRRFIMRRAIQCAAIIALLLTISTSLWYSQQFNNDTLSNTFSEISPVKYPENILGILSSTPQLIADNRIQHNSTVKNKKDYDIKPLSAHQSIDEAMVTAYNENLCNKMTLKQQEIIPLTDRRNVKLKNDYENYLQHTNPIVQTTPQLSKHKKNETDINYSLECIVSPSYTDSQYNSTIPNTRGRNYSDSEMKGGFKVGGGVKFVMSTNKRLSFQTGILYNQIFHSTIENNVYYPRNSQTLSTFTNKNHVINSALGRIKNKSQAVVFQSEQLVPTDYSGTAKQSAIEHEFMTIDIPLLIKYKIIDYKVDIHLLGGFSGSFMINNKAYLEYNNSREYLGKTEDIRPFNLSANVGFVLEYPILKHISILAEPGFKYYLQSFSQDNQILFKPYAFSFSTGIGVTF